MAGDPEIVSFVESLPSGSTSHFVDFPQDFGVPPLVTTSLQNNEISEIVPHNKSSSTPSKDNAYPSHTE